MPISMACPQCSARFNFGDDSAGKKARCQRCQNVFTIQAPPPPSPDVLDINLELVADPPPAPPAKPAPIKAAPAPAKVSPKPPARPARQDTSADDFDAAAFGGFDAGGKSEERPSRRRRDEDEEDDRPSRRRSRDDDEEEDPKPRGRRRRAVDDDDEDEPAFNRNQRRQGDLAERGSGSGVRGGKYPFWLKLAIFVVVLAVTAGSVQFWLKDQNEEEGTFTKIKKKVIRYAILTIVILFVLCGGISALVLGLFGTRQNNPPPINHQPGPGPQPPGPNPGPKPVEVNWRTARTPDPAPDWNQWKVAADLSLEVKVGERAWYSESPGKFLAIGRATNRLDLTIWDLQSGKKTGEIKGTRTFRPNEWTTLSRDGQYFAHVTSQQVIVHPAAAGRSALTFSGEPGSIPVWADFPGKDRLVTLFRISDRNRLETWDLTNGARGSYAAVMEYPMVGQPTLSPNGRFFAHLAARSLDVYDTASTRASRSSPINRLPALQEPNRTVQEVYGLTYSPDGLAIAAYVRHNEGEAIVQWSVPDGNIARQLTVTNLAVLPGYRNRRLEWLPNRRGWLVNGIHFIDGNGRIIERRDLTPIEARTGLRRIVDDTQMLSTRTEGNTQRVVVTPLPK